MALEMDIQLLRKNLIKLQHSRHVIDPMLARQLTGSITVLDEVEGSLKNIAGNHASLDMELLQAIFLAEDTLETFLLTTPFQKHKVVFSFMHFKSVYVQTSFINQMEKLVSDLRKKSLLLESVSNTKQPKLFLERLDGRVKELAKLILDDSLSFFHISVVDVAGSAKSTELGRIYNSLEVKNQFKCRAWVHVSQEFEKQQFLIDIARQFSFTSGIKVEVQEKLPLAGEQQLHNFLIEKRYLVVLIDARTPDIWEILKNAFPNSLNGSRVIFSFREADAARNPDVRFYGRENLLPSDDMGLPSRETNYVGNDIDSFSDKDLDQRMEGVFNEETDIVVLKDKILELAKLTLKQTKYSLISVVGVAGSGKTTLVKTIYNNSYIRQSFDCRAWVNVYVTNDFDKRNVLLEILKQVTQEKDEEGLPLDKLETKLFDILSQKRFLIVLDDLHQPGAWYDLERILSPSSLSSSRVILITRDTSVARVFSPTIVLFQLRLLNVDETWALFLKKAMIGDEIDNPDLMELKRKVWQKCHGLPLAIGVLGGLLSFRNSNYSEWSKVIDEIMPGEKKKEGAVELGKQEDGSVIENTASDEDQSISLNQFASSLETLGPYIWTMGYKELSSHLRACIDYFCLFPRSYEIPVRRLFQLWLAERFVTSEELEKTTGEQKRTLEDLVNENFKQLERRNMIQVARQRSDGTPKTCLVPNTLYDTLFQNAEGMRSFHIHTKSDSTSNSHNLCIRRLAEHSDIQNNSFSDSCIRYLHSYISFNTRKGDKPAEEVGKFLNKTINKRGFRLLRVLDLEHVYKPVLPETLGKLKLLRYIGLRWTFLDSIPMSIGDLPQLETLDVKHTNITALPISIWRTKTLRHLFMNEIHFQMSIQKPFSSYSLTNLQTLWGLFIGSNCPPIEWLKKRLSGLKKLGLTCHTKSLGKVTEWICELTSLQSLRLRSINDFGEPSDLDLGFIHELKNLTELYLVGKFSSKSDVSQLPPKLKILTLSVSHLSDDPMPKLGELKELNILRLLAHSYIGERMNCLQGKFPELRVLKLWVLKELKEWTIAEETMPKLKELEIRYCLKLKNLDGLENLKGLEELILTNMGNDFKDKVEKSKGKKAVITENNWTINPPWD